jgi:hypothetical protein
VNSQILPSFLTEGNGQQQPTGAVAEIVTTLDQTIKDDSNQSLPGNSGRMEGSVAKDQDWSGVMVAQ